MDLLTLIFRLPFLPAQGVIRLAELIQEQAEQELYDPARVRRELEEAQRRWEAGEITDDELAEFANQLTSSLVTEPVIPGADQNSDDRS